MAALIVTLAALAAFVAGWCIGAAERTGDYDLFYPALGCLLASPILLIVGLTW